MNPPSKFSLRKKFRALRAQIPTRYREQAAKNAAQILSVQRLFQDSQHVACYLAYQDEFDTTPIIEAIWAAKKNCYLPVLAQDDSKQLEFVLYEYGMALHLNRYSILEPVNVENKMAARALELVITPLVAFDLLGHRLGTGGGFYDHTFSFINDEKINFPTLLGLGYAVSQADSLPVDPWDIKLNDVLTEQAWHHIR